MGLDMYLYAKQLFSSSSWTTEDECEKVKIIAEMMNATHFLDPDDLQFVEVRIQIAYWRKANQIHRYFVDTYGGGEDNCQSIYVPKKGLEVLLSKCETILEDKSRAEELLPVQLGFFFGGTDYDEWYYRQLEYTIPILQKILKESSDVWEFEYQASW